MHAKCQIIVARLHNTSNAQSLGRQFSIPIGVERSSLHYSSRQIDQSHNTTTRPRRPHNTGRTPMDGGSVDSAGCSAKAPASGGARHGSASPSSTYDGKSSSSQPRARSHSQAASSSRLSEVQSMATHPSPDAWVRRPVASSRRDAK
eukprot:scaffold3422_cov28-Tisochrysis_lutea.AAC.1